MKCICHHNKEVDCETPKCDTCGWNPAVTVKRLRKITSGQVKMAGDKKYRVPFTGYCEVYAQDEQEALDRADTIEQQFFAHYDYGNPICEEDEK